MKNRLFPLAAALALLIANNASGQDLTANLDIKDHKFYPSTIKVPAGEKIKLVFTNYDTTPEEPESNSMSFEKIIPAGGRATIFVRPLKAGTYSFMGDFNQSTAQGTIIAQ